MVRSLLFPAWAATFLAAAHLRAAEICLPEIPQPPSRQPTEAEQARLRSAGEAGEKLMDQGKFAEALAEFQKALALDGKPDLLLHNAGMAALLSGNQALAAAYFKRFKALHAEDLDLRALIIRCCQVCGAQAERDAERRELLQYVARKRREGMAPAKPFYFRDEFAAAGRKVRAMESFFLEGEQPVRYTFVVLDKEGAKADFVLSLGSYDVVNKIARAQGEIQEGERLFHLDGYYEDGRKRLTYEVFKGEPDYDRARKAVEGILAGKVKPLSGWIQEAHQTPEKGEAKKAAP